MKYTPAYLKKATVALDFPSTEFSPRFVDPLPLALLSALLGNDFSRGAGCLNPRRSTVFYPLPEHRAQQPGRKGRFISISSEPIRRPSDSDPVDQIGCLTDQQQTFAEVVGRALAEAWRRRCQKLTDKPIGSSQQHARLSTRTQ